MRRITIKRARTWHYRKMRPCIERSNAPAQFPPFRSWLDCTTNTSGYDFRKGQAIEKVRTSARLSNVCASVMRKRFETEDVPLYGEPET